MRSYYSFTILGIFLLAIPPNATDNPPKAPAPDIAKLIGQLGSKRFAEREQAEETLIAIGAPALELLRKSIKSPDPEIARRAQGCILVIERNARIAALVKRFSDRDRDLGDRDLAVRELVKLREHAAPALPALLAALDEGFEMGDDETTHMAMWAIGAIGPKAADAVPKLIKVLRERKSPAADRVVVSDVVMNLTAIGALEEIGPAARDAVPILVDLLSKGDGLTKIGCAVALFSICGDTKRTLPVLVSLLGDSELNVWVNAAAAIGRIGKEPDLCVPLLVKALTAHRQEWFASVTQRIVRQEREPCQTMLRALAVFGPEAKAAVPTLIGFLKEHPMNWQVQLTVVKVLASIGPGAKEAVPVLRDWAHPHVFCSNEALQALRAIEIESIKPGR